MIEWSPKILQAFVALILLWVWLFRFGRPTSFRCGRAKDLKEEFSAYGLPEWSFWAVGSCKVLLSLSLLAGLYFEQLVKPTALALTVFMFAAVWMHLKMRRDSLVKAAPAYLLFMACVFLVFD
jgi:hypothetical protein